MIILIDEIWSQTLIRPNSLARVLSKTDLPIWIRKRESRTGILPNSWWQISSSVGLIILIHDSSTGLKCVPIPKLSSIWLKNVDSPEFLPIVFLLLGNERATQELSIGVQNWKLIRFDLIDDWMTFTIDQWRLGICSDLETLKIYSYVQKMWIY